MEDTPAGRLPATGGGPLARLQEALPALTGTARACGEFVLANPWDVRSLSIRDVASRASVSTHAVNRFTRRLGYSGYREFLQAMGLELGRIVGAAYAVPQVLAEGFGTADPPPDAGGIVSRVLALEAKGIQDTLRELDLDAVTKAVRVLSQADGILFIGTGTGVTVGELAAYRLRTVGLRATCAGDPAEIFPELHLLGARGAVVAVSHQGVTRHTVEALEHARERELTTICVTAAPRSPVARLADVTIVTKGEEHPLGVGLFTSRVAAAAILEGIVAAVAWERRGTALPHGEAVMQVLQRRNAVTSSSRRFKGGSGSERGRMNTPWGVEESGRAGDRRDGP